VTLCSEYGKHLNIARQAPGVRANSDDFGPRIKVKLKCYN